MNKEKVLIIGAGPAGLGAALRLSKEKIPLNIIEKNDAIGGLSRTLKYGEFKTDIGPHRFYSENSYLNKFMEDLLDKQWLEVKRLTRVFIKGKYFYYPIEVKDILLNISIYKACRIIIDYLYEKVKIFFLKYKPSSFEQKIILNFGKTLAELNILNYSEKIWGLPCSEISVDWASQRIKDLCLGKLIKNMFLRPRKNLKTLTDYFYYPALGAGISYEMIKNKILSKGNCIINLNSHPKEIYHNGNKITKITFNINGSEQEAVFDHVISSMPITELISLLKPQAPSNILKLAQKMRFRSHLSLFVIINKKSIFPDQWIYFPDKDIPFGRISEPRNFSRELSPDYSTSLLIEFFCWKNDKIWSATKEDLLELSMPWLEKIFQIERAEIAGYHVHKEEHAYPVYSLDYKMHLDEIKNYLKQFINLQCIGRSGIFRYNNQDHSLEMGILAARNIIDGKLYNIEYPGSKQEYYEEGIKNDDA